MEMDGLMTLQREVTMQKHNIIKLIRLAHRRYDYANITRGKTSDPYGLVY